MARRLDNAVSPYLRSHADNPVDWWQWGPEAFEEARRREVPVMISIGYATCHWCHVMARETFSDPAVAEWLNERVVSIKVDREEHPQVDAAYLAAAGAFSEQLGWPLTVFATPEGRTFYAATYLPPQPMQGIPSFLQVAEAVLEAWSERHEEVLQSAEGLQDALRAAAQRDEGALPTVEQLGDAVTELVGYEDREHGGFGGAPKFPVAPVLLFLQAQGSTGDRDAAELAQRTLERLAASPLRDPVEGGFFRYATRRDWSEPHYERMLYDNALLLEAYTRAGLEEPAAGIIAFFEEVLRVPGGLASGQDSESVLNGERSEGGYYALTAAERAEVEPPALDAKVLTAWNGLAIGGLAVAARRLADARAAERARALAVELADDLLAAHRLPDDEHGRARLARASRDGRLSEAAATLEDYGDLAVGLLELAVTTGEARWASVARGLVDACIVPPTGSDGVIVRPPGGEDPTLVAHGLATIEDPQEGAAPSGISALARAALLLHQLTAEPGYRALAEGLLAPLAALAVPRPIGFGAMLAVTTDLAHPSRQLIVVSAPGDDAHELVAHARASDAAGTLALAVTTAQAAEWVSAGFALLADRVAVGGRTTAYLCTDFVCRLPVTSLRELTAEA